MVPQKRVRDCGQCYRYGWGLKTPSRTQTVSGSIFRVAAAAELYSAMTGWGQP